MVTWCPTKKLGPIGSAVLTSIGFKQTNRQTRQIYIQINRSLILGAVAVYWTWKCKTNTWEDCPPCSRRFYPSTVPNGTRTNCTLRKRGILILWLSKTIFKCPRHLLYILLLIVLIIFVLNVIISFGINELLSSLFLIQLSNILIIKNKDPCKLRISQSMRRSWPFEFLKSLIFLILLDWEASPNWGWNLPCSRKWTGGERAQREIPQGKRMSDPS